jgi:hypothetical protein
VFFLLQPWTVYEQHVFVCKLEIPKCNSIPAFTCRCPFQPTFKQPQSSNFWNLNPYNSLRPKTGQLQLGQLVWRKIILFQIFLLDNQTTYFIRFPGTPSTSNSDSELNEPMMKFCSKWVLSSFFLYFLRSSYTHPCGWNCPRTKGRVLRKKFVLPIESWFFTFFSLFFFYSWFCMMSPSMWLLRSKCNFLKEFLQGL